MDTSIALAYIPQRMERLGYEHYSMQHIQLNLQASEEVNIKAYNQYYILLDNPVKLKVESDMGIYDTELYTNRQQHEHQGSIFIKNTDTENTKRVDFIQVIPSENF